MAFWKKSHNFLSQLSSFAASTGMRRSSKASLLPTPNLIDLLTSRISSNKTQPSVSISMFSKTPPTAPWKQKLPRQQILLCHLYTYTHILKIMPSILKPGVLFFPLLRQSPHRSTLTQPPQPRSTSVEVSRSRPRSSKNSKNCESKQPFPLQQSRREVFLQLEFFHVRDFFRIDNKKLTKVWGGFVIAGLVL